METDKKNENHVRVISNNTKHKSDKIQQQEK